MGDEVTKKDLQSLQGYCNKQIADVKKQIADLEKRIGDVEKRLGDLEKHVSDYEKTLDTAFANVDNNDAELLKGHIGQNKRLDEIAAIVNIHTKQIAELQS